MHRRLMGVPEKERVEEILELVGLTEARNVKYKKFSLGDETALGHRPGLVAPAGVSGAG